MSENFELKTGKITGLFDMGEGTRIEIDFIDVLSSEEGVLIGDSARGFFVPLAETRVTKTYPARPFRVNAGAVHQYVYVGENKTKYLSELKAGDRVFVTDGIQSRMVTVGRVKQEKRPFRRIETDLGVSATFQIADSLFIKTPSGCGHFLDLKVGDEISCKTETAVARHKGEILKEEILEK